MTAVELVVTDLDGTLWRTADEIHPRVRDAWSELKRIGIPILPASGRRVTSMRVALGAFGWQPPVVALNGAIGIDLGTGKEFHRKVFDSEFAREVLDVFRERALEPCVYVDHQDVDVFVSEHPSTNPGHLTYLGDSARVGDLEEIVATLPIFAFGLLGCPFDRLDPVAADLSGRAATSLQKTFEYDGVGLTVVPLGLSKWAGVLAYCDRTGINDTRVLAIGDGPNDVELLQNAALSISLKGSHPSALSAAQHVVPSVEEGGWADLVELLGR
jgi:hydroxymethylpyrimidine pyrophosphatase-like HAD family hydrolase